MTNDITSRAHFPAAFRHLFSTVQGWADKSRQNCEAYNRASDLNEKLKICGRHA